MSCRPAVPQTTRSYVVRRLDDADQELTLLKKAKGSDCLDKVCKSLGLLEKEYFGLQYEDKGGETLWVNLRNPLHEQIPMGSRIIMEMRVKYFIQPHKILQPVTRYQYYQQTKSDIIQGRLPLDTAERATLIMALMMQVDYGDYKQGNKYPHQVEVQEPIENLEAKVMREYQKLTGLSTEIAIEKFLNGVAKLPLYGVELYPTSGQDRYVGIGPEGITLYTWGKMPLKSYRYASVKYTAFHGKKFKAVIRQPSSRVTEELDIELTSRASSQALYRAVTEFYTFFKRDTVSHVVKTAGYCKSLLGNIKSQLPDRFYFDVTRTHKEVINHVWTLLNSPEGSNPATSPQHGSRLRRGRSQHDPLPPIPTASRMGSSSTTAHSHHHHHHHPSGSRLQRAVSLQNRVRPNMSFQEAQQQLPPLPPFTQVSHSADGIVINNRAHLAPMAAATSMASVNPYTSPSLSEASDDASSTYSSSEYTTMSSRFGPGYSPNSHSQSLATPSERSDSYISAGESAHSTVSNTSSRNHPSLNSPPPLYSEVDPDPSSAPVMDFSDVPQSAGLSLVSPVPIISQGVFSFDTTCVLTRTRELEGELQRLRSAMTCRLCKQNPIGATFCPCGHTVCCFQCAQRLRTCWECDQSVHSVQRMLLASAV